jgi:5-methyltetrahydropteroyltriglutamate--homocysteine methyltransferase
MGKVIPANLNNYPRIGDRPEQQKLRRTIAALDRGEASLEDLERVQREVTREVILEQVEAGIQLVTDGQIRWDDPVTYFARSLEGIRIAGLVRFFDTNTYFRQPVVEAPVRWQWPVLVDDFRFAAEASPVPVKAVVPGPYTLARLSVDRYYSDLPKLTSAYAAAVREEIRALMEAGAQVIQIDEPSLVRHRDAVEVALPALAGLAELERSDSVRLGLLTYWGTLDQNLDRVLELPFDFLALDLVEGRRDLEGLSRWKLKGKVFGLGLVNGRNTKLEDPAELAAAVKRIQDSCGFPWAYLQPSCGLEFLPRDTARRKLEIIAEAARLVSE